MNLNVLIILIFQIDYFDIFKILKVLFNLFNLILIDFLIQVFLKFMVPVFHFNFKFMVYHFFYLQALPNLYVINYFIYYLCIN